MIEQAIKEYYGERCSDHDDDCVVCQAWEQWDQIAPATVDAIRVEDELPTAEHRAVLIKWVLSNPIQVRS
jgi:hypothetical protein